MYTVQITDTRTGEVFPTVEHMEDIIRMVCPTDQRDFEEIDGEEGVWMMPLKPLFEEDLESRGVVHIETPGGWLVTVELP